MAICSFIKSADARNISRNHTIIWAEICEIQAAVLAAIDNNLYSTIITDGTPFTELQEITSVTVTAAGTDYNVVKASATIDANGTGGTGATIVPIVTGQVITDFTITNGGSGYTPVSTTATLASPSDLDDTQDETDFDGAGGDGTFTAGNNYFVGEVITLTENSTATVDAITGTGFVTIASQDETDYDNVGANGTFTAGSGYAGGDAITLSDGTVVTADTVVAGAITEFTVTTSSTSSRATGIQRVQLSTDGSGVGFTLTTGTNNETAVGNVTQFSIASPSAVPFFLGSNIIQATTTGIGTGFSLAPSSLNVSTLPGGVGATLTPIVTNGSITAVVVNTPGSGYLPNTPVVFTHPSGINGTANVSSVGGSGEVLAVTVTNGGSGYAIVNPLVTVDHPTGFSFAGTVQQTGGVITGISIQDGGSLFGDLFPTATISDSTGSGAVLSVSLVDESGAESSISAITVVDGGSGYSQSPSVIITPAATDTNATGATATATSATNAFGTDPSLYLDVLQGQASDRVIQDQIQFVLDYFTALGYNIRAQVNPATNNTIQWQISF